MKTNINTYHNMNLRDYGSLSYSMRWITEDEAMRADERRSSLIEKLSPSISIHAKGSKICYKGMSPGCVLCMNGLWSCVFINNICNAGCFFCPNEQNTFTVPETAGLKFRRPEQYAEYCRLFGIDGVSISGGEPLLTPNRTASFVRKSREILGDTAYMWIYSNSILADDGTLKTLKDLGINEIRFNIASRNYNTEAARRAVKYIPAVTVEIPAIPADLPKLKKAVKELDDAGVSYLNLHQIRSTPYNCRGLIERDYTFVPGPHPAVLESELAALEAMSFTAGEGLNIAVNYCSFVYRHRYQARAAASRFSRIASRTYESVTERGFIRQTGVSGSNQKINDIASGLRESSVDPGLWSVAESGSELYLHPSIFNKIIIADLPLMIKYEQVISSDGESGRGDAGISLGAGMKIFFQRKPLFKTVLDGPEKEIFIAGFNNNADSIYLPSFDESSTGGAAKLNELESYELIPAGMQKYLED